MNLIGPRCDTVRERERLSEEREREKQTENFSYVLDNLKMESKTSWQGHRLLSHKWRSRWRWVV